MSGAERVLEEHSQDGYTVRLLHVPDGSTADGPVDEHYLVTCSDGQSEDNEPFDDYGPAYSGYRTVVRQAFGVNLPYKAPVAIMPEPEPEEAAAMTAVDLLYHYFGRITAAGAGSNALTALIQEIEDSPEVALHAEEMLRTFTGHANWAAGILRQSLRRVIQRAKEQEVAEIAALPNFGRF